MCRLRAHTRNATRTAMVARVTGMRINAINDNKGSKSVVEEESSCCWLGKSTEKSGSY